MAIHPSAIIDPRAQLGADVHVGPYAVIDGPAVIGHRCRIAGHAQLLGQVEMGDDCEIGPGAIIGGDPQDLGFDRAKATGVRLGARNRIREHVTIHRSATEGSATILGNGNYLMAGAHVGHDSRLGDDNILANNCLLGGHVSLGNGIFLGGAAVFHQFVRVGDRCMVQGMGGFSLDLPPFVIGAGVNFVAGLNSVGLRRAGYDAKVRGELKELFSLIYRQGHLLRHAVALAAERATSAAGQAFVAFFQAPSRKGVCVRLHGVANSAGEAE